MTNKPVTTRPLSRASQLVVRLLEEPRAVEVIQSLDGKLLLKLIDHIGLEDSGEIVALATTEQLTRIFDDDLWKNGKPGTEEKLDARRFALWLEVMLDAGTEFAAAKIAELDEDFVTAALVRQLFVIDIDQLAIQATSGLGPSVDDLTQKALESSLAQEFEQYLVVSRDHDSWDAILALLVALDEKHHELMTRILERCSFISSEQVEEQGGLYTVLTELEELENDVAYDREQRREREGYVAPLSAAGFLELARKPDVDAVLAENGYDPLTAGYFKSFEKAGARSGPSASEHGDGGISAKLESFLDSLSGGTKSAALGDGRLLLSVSTGDNTEGGSCALLRDALSVLRGQNIQSNEALSRKRMEELGYLSNVLVAGGRYDGKRFRPLEAAAAAFAICNLGLEATIGGRNDDAPDGGDGERAAAAVLKHDLTKLFRVGWSMLYWLVLAQTTKSLIEKLSKLKVSAKLVSTLTAKLKAGKPWEARGQLGLLQTISDGKSVRVLEIVLDQCPAIPESSDAPRFIANINELRATVEACAKVVSALSP